MKWSMLFGLAAIAIPIIIHLLNRRKAVLVDWGAMRFLLGSFVNRNRRMLIEEMLLLALRCLLLALVALAMARPFIPAGSRTPWGILLPAVLLAVMVFGAGTAVWRRRGWRWTLYALAVGLLLVAAAAVGAERWFQLRRWAGAGGGQDIAIVIDGSASMTLTVDGQTNFERAVEEARSIVDSVGQADAVSIIVAGPIPQVITPAPLVEREDLHRILGELTPTRGSMSVLSALNAAGITLAEGHNPVKKIVFITDGQNVGWHTTNRARWEFLAAALDDLPSRPKVVCRTLSLPETFRNAGVADIVLSSGVIGPDRPVRVEVRVENTGDEPISPFSVELEVDGQAGETRTVSRLEPGTAETVKFTHRFAKGGLHVVRARAMIHDDLPADNTAVRVVKTLDRLPVLIVDGNPAERWWDRASAFIGIALAPGLGARSPAPDGLARGEEPWRVFVRPRVIDAPAVSGGVEFDRYSVVILANVPQLPSAAAKALCEFVSSGGGLLIAPGDGALPAFYNGWKTAGGLPVSPARLLGRKAFSKPDESARPSVSTFTHKALEKVADKASSDLDTAHIAAYWRLGVDETDRTVTVCGMLDTADPLLVERSLGSGRVLMTAVSLDNKGSNLPTLRSFVPFVHEMVYYLIQPARAQWNFDPAVELAVQLGAETDSSRATRREGLRGDYYADHTFGDFAMTQIDPEVNFRWTRSPVKRAPGRRFSVRWTGSIVSRYSETHTFSLLVRGGAAGLWIDGKQVIDVARGKGHAQTGAVGLKAGKRHDIRVQFIKDWPAAIIALAWSSPSQLQEAVPRERLSPVRPSSAQIAHDDVAELTSPDGSKRNVKIAAEGGAALVHIRDAAEPGLYRLKLPGALKESLGHLLDREGSIPFAVKGDIEEGRLAALSRTEMDHVAQHVDFFHAESSEQMIAAVVGGVPGDELWKYLAMGALVAVLAEIALARWIAQQRKTGATEVVSFSSGAVDPEAYRKRARELLDVSSSN